MKIKERDRNKLERKENTSTMRFRRVTLSMLLSLALTASFMPAAAFAQEASEAENIEVKTQADGGVTVSGLDSDELLMQYIDEAVEEELSSSDEGMMHAAAVNTRRAALKDNVAASMYDALAPKIRKVAAGELSDTSFTFPASEIFEYARFSAENLGVDNLFVEGEENTITAEAFEALKSTLTKVLSDSLKTTMFAMISDMPYEMYWLDSEKGITFEFEQSLESSLVIYKDGRIGVEPNESLEMTFNCLVSQDYSLGGSQKQYGPAETTNVDTSFTKAAAGTAKNISGIIEGAKNESDVIKLVTYRDKICDLVEYNHAAWDNESTPYGDPWQLIYVFDNDPNTNVVCEGYSKAFQYLCDKSTFSDTKAESRIASGKFTQTKGGKKVAGGDHMWNIVHIDNNNYIADVTNCDGQDKSDIKGYAKDVFLAGALPGGSVAKGYSFIFGDGTVSYEYEDGIKGIYTEEELTLSAKTYPGEGGSSADIKPNTMKASGKKVTLKARTLKKKKQTIERKKAITVSKAQGNVTYKLKSVSKKSAKSKFSIAAKTGKITVKKGLKKGTYKLKIEVTASGGKNNFSKTIPVCVTVKVK